MEKPVLDIHVSGDTKELVLRAGSANDVYEYHGMHIATKTTDSFLAAVKRFGTKENTVIAGSGARLSANIDCTVTDRPADTIEQTWVISPDVRRWQSILGKTLNQVQLIRFLEQEYRLTYSSRVEQLTGTLKALKFSAQIFADYQYDDSNNYTVSFKTADGEGHTKIPTTLQLYMKVLEDGRTGAASKSELVDILIDFHRPDKEGERPTFLLTWPSCDEVVRKAIETELEIVKAGLPDWLILQGSI